MGAGMTGMRRVLITGSTQGVGLAAARAFAGAGCEVIIHGHSADRAEAVAAELRDRGGRAEARAADLTDRAQIAALIAEAGLLDVLVNCAGVVEKAPAAAVDTAAWAHQMDINLTAPWILAQGFLPGLRARQGVIVNLASDSALIGTPDASVYCASQGALIGLSRALAIELAPLVRVVCICPGPVATDVPNAAIAPLADRRGAAPAKAFAPQGRLASTAEVAALILYAASADAGFATGAVWTLDGGTTAGKPG